MKAFAALFLLVTVACAPQMQTQYEIVPPKSDSGRYCANGCLGGKSQCDQSCFAQQASCERMASFEMGFGYGFGNSRFGHGLHHNDGFDDYDRRRQCDPSECLNRCTQDYNVCHTNCGGSVIQRNVCVANCGE